MYAWNCLDTNSVVFQTIIFHNSNWPLRGNGNYVIARMWPPMYNVHAYTHCTFKFELKLFHAYTCTPIMPTNEYLILLRYTLYVLCYRRCESNCKRWIHYACAGVTQDVVDAMEPETKWQCKRSDCKRNVNVQKKTSWHGQKNSFFAFLQNRLCSQLAPSLFLPRVTLPLLHRV